MRWKLSGGLTVGTIVALVAWTMSAQEPERPNPVLETLRRRLQPEFECWSPQQVMDRCAEHLATINQVDRDRIRYFDLSDAPRAVLPVNTAALFFGLNQASSGTVTVRPQAVPNSDDRLFWIDLGWYRWTPALWTEAVAKEEPYYRVPLVGGKSYEYLKRHQADGVVRAAWFLYYAYDTTTFLKKNEVRADNALHYRLIYGDKVPKTAAEFEKFWGLDAELLKDYPVDLGAMLDEGESGVSYGNRLIWRVRTKRGVYYRTFDVFISAGDQDFLEVRFPTEFDAGEHIMQDERGAQFYLLTNGKGERVEFADPRVVNGAPAGNRVLLTSHSCIHCHVTGILPFKNTFAALDVAGLRVKAHAPGRLARVQQFYLQDKRLRKLVTDDQGSYSAFLLDCNGLTPQENATQFSRARTWYSAPVTVEQAARECGVTPALLKDALSTGVRGRLGAMALLDRPIPRMTWERGNYQEAMLLLRSYLERAKIPPAP